MATKKRKKSRKLNGLAGSPEHHRAEMVKGYARAHKQFQLMQQEIKHGMCDVAFETLLVGSQFFEQAEAHAKEPGLTRREMAERQARANKMMAATDDFKKHCVLRKA